MIKTWTFVLIGCCLTLSNCGYHLQDSSNPLYETEGVQKVFIRPLINATYKAGVENIVFNALVKRINSHKKLKLVNFQEDADAIITGTITSASYQTQSATSATSVRPVNTGPNDETVALSYLASLGAEFSLVKYFGEDGNKKSLGKTIWSSGFSREKSFAANNTLGVLGTTSSLINESEFERALRDLSEDMMGDVHEAMTALF